MNKILNIIKSESFVGWLIVALFVALIIHVILFIRKQKELDEQFEQLQDDYREEVLENMRDRILHNQANDN